MAVMSLSARSQPPILVEVVRGQMVESRHRASIAVVDAHAKIVAQWGDIEQPIYGRSAIKPLLAIPLVETGAAEAFQVSDAEVALACASHNGEAGHFEAVLAWLQRIGLSTEDLECGAQAPSYEPSYIAMIKAGGSASRAHNNCSGKHAGFLSTALHLGEPTKGYIRYDHPIQQRLLGVLEQMCGLELGAAQRGIDGCGIPVIATPIGNLALAMARMADPHHLSSERRQACARVLRSMMEYPFNVAGTDRFCTIVMEALRGKAAIKVGAEGVYTGALPELGLGIALKIEDGASRAAEIAMGQILKKLDVIDQATEAALARVLTPAIRNWAGTQTGAIRPIEDGSF
jgi:L-asparaginase II